MALFLASVDGTTVTTICAALGGCGHEEHERDALIFRAGRDLAGDLATINYDCPACGARAFAPLLDDQAVAATLADSAVVEARVAWAAYHGRATPEQLRIAPYLSWPIPPGEQTRNAAALWAALQEAGWPAVDQRERNRRHDQALGRWPVIA